jgi:hypothetical protein
MADQAYNHRLSQNGTPAIVRPLPLEDARRFSGPYACSASVMRAGLFRVDEGWFDAYWYGQRSAAKPRLLGRVVRLLRSMIAAARSGLMRSTRRGASDAHEHQAPDPLVGQEG